MYSTTASRDIYTKLYDRKKNKNTTTLLHIASKNGYLPLINDIKMLYGTELKSVLKTQDCSGNTPAHIAADNNRHAVLQVFQVWGANLTIKNKKWETVNNIVQERFQFISKFSAHYESALISLRITAVEAQEATQPKQTVPTGPIRDPQFVYGDRVGEQPKHQSTNTQSAVSLAQQIITVNPPKMHAVNKGMVPSSSKTGNIPTGNPTAPPAQMKTAFDFAKMYSSTPIEQSKPRTTYLDLINKHTEHKMEPPKKSNLMNGNDTQSMDEEKAEFSPTFFARNNPSKDSGRVKERENHQQMALKPKIKEVKLSIIQQQGAQQQAQQRAQQQAQQAAAQRAAYKR